MMWMDGSWWLCAPCWREGIATQPAKPAEVTREIGREPIKSPAGLVFTGGTGTFVPDGDGFW